MSEYKSIAIDFKDKEVLVKSLKDMGYNPEVYDKAKCLQGYQGDNRTQRAHVIIPRKQVGGASNDVGFEWANGGFVLHASEYDRAWREKGHKIKKLKMTYSENIIKNFVDKNSKMRIINRRETEKGQIRISISLL